MLGYIGAFVKDREKLLEDYQGSFKNENGGKLESSDYSKTYQ